MVGVKVGNSVREAAGRSALAAGTRGTVPVSRTATESKDYTDLLSTLKWMKKKVKKIEKKIPELPDSNRLVL